MILKKETKPYVVKITCPFTFNKQIIIVNAPTEDEALLLFEDAHFKGCDEEDKNVDLKMEIQELDLTSPVTYL